MKNYVFLMDIYGMAQQVNLFEVCCIQSRYVPEQKAAAKILDWVIEVSFLFKSGASRIIYVKFSELKKILNEEAYKESLRKN